MRLYHGTDEDSAEKIRIKIILNKGDIFTDNGQGFYLSDELIYAKDRAKFAVDRLMSILLLRSGRISKRNPEILKFDFNKDKAAEDLNMLIFDDDSENWRFFVTFNRIGAKYIKEINELFPEKINNINLDYDIVIDMIAEPERISMITKKVESILEKYSQHGGKIIKYRNKIFRLIRRVKVDYKYALTKQYSFHSERALKYLEIIEDV